MLWTQEKISETLSTAIDRAMNDDAFRAEAMANGNAAIAKLAGLELPPGFSFNFVEGEGLSVTVAVPRAAAEGELSDDALEAVAGGVSAQQKQYNRNPAPTPAPTSGNNKPR